MVNMELLTTEEGDVIAVAQGRTNSKIWWDRNAG